MAYFYRYNDVKNTEPKPNNYGIDARDAEIARLKAALEKAELHARFLDTLIDVAEENLNVQIRKKPASNSDAPSQSGSKP